MGVSSSKRSGLWSPKGEMGVLLLMRSPFPPHWVYVSEVNFEKCLKIGGLLARGPALKRASESAASRLLPPGRREGLEVHAANGQLLR